MTSGAGLLIVARSSHSNENRYKDGSNTVALLKAQVALTRTQNALLAAPRMTTETLGETAMTDVEQQNWQSLGVVYNELRFRG